MSVCVHMVSDAKTHRKLIDCHWRVQNWVYQEERKMYFASSHFHSCCFISYCFWHFSWWLRYSKPIPDSYSVPWFLCELRHPLLWTCPAWISLPSELWVGDFLVCFLLQHEAWTWREPCAYHSLWKFVAGGRERQREFERPQRKELQLPPSGSHSLLSCQGVYMNKNP